MIDDEPRVFRLAAQEFFVLWTSVHGDRHPPPVGTRHYGRTEADRAELLATCSRTLSARGLGTVERPDGELHALLRGLVEFDVGLELVFSRRGETARGLATAGWHGAFVARVGEQVQLAGFRPTALASTTVSTLPAARPGAGRSVNLRWDDYVAAGAAGERDGVPGFLGSLRYAGVREPEATTLMRALTTRSGGGQVAVIGRNRAGYLHPTGRTLSWLDSSDGRYLVRNEAGWFVMAPTDPARLTTELEDLVEGASRD
ncbi:ESX secretion-associated protein EspG [Umezawaea tangerina]|uniref:ESAT-6 protein secretion system EspG family protein n=1 Tax=Umezawaea tangerina TaxID=84725 RepID=A0A2T0TKD0_9PSEU|nr:ESX secretion-associated protein EspG [Umezawaea tangerina]PRY46085.1 ESAT-6 protein secretion system EspG family protein [Umezawaea tangerina]